MATVYTCMEIHRPGGASWSCTMENPTGFGFEDLAKMRELVRTLPENTLVKVRLDADRPGRKRVFEFRWWRGRYDTRPPRPKSPTGPCVR